MRTPEQLAVLRSVRKLVDFWHITAEELDMGPQAKKLVDAEPQPDPAPSGPKYMHPRTFQTWDGVGGQPQWLKEALTREGFTVEELRLKSDARA